MLKDGCCSKTLFTFKIVLILHHIHFSAMTATVILASLLQPKCSVNMLPTLLITVVTKRMLKGTE